MPLNSTEIGVLATCIVALGLSLYAWQRERNAVKSSPSTRAKLFRYALLLSIVSPTVCGFFLLVPIIASLGDKAIVLVPVMGSLGDKAIEMVVCSGMICSLFAILLGFAGTGSQGPLVVASGGLSGSVWFMGFAMFMIRYL